MVVSKTRKLLKQQYACAGKVRHLNEHSARLAVAQHHDCWRCALGYRFTVYRCRLADQNHFHVGHRRQP